MIKLTRLVETAPYDKDVNELLIKLTRLVETAPYDKFWTYAIWDVLYKLHSANVYADNEVLYPLTYVIIDAL